MRRSLVLLVGLAACSADRQAEQYGFVTLLGRDTIAVEHVSRSPGKLVSDDVDRFPVVRQRHTEIAVAPDGSIMHMAMDIRTPSGATPRERGRRVTAEFTRDSIRISIRDSSGVKDTAFATGGALTVPHVSQLYSVIELEIAAAMARGVATGIGAGDSIPFRQFYPDRDIGPNFVLHSGFVHPVPGGRVELWHDWLSGIGDATLDSSRRLLAYSGERSTYKVSVTRIAEPLDIEAIGARFAATEQRIGASQLSVRDTMRATIGTATFTVDYGRPLARGRELLGNIIAYDYVWRTGANAATQFTTSASILLDGLTLPAGTYSIWTAPHKDGVELIVNTQSGQWGTEYDSQFNLGTAPLHTERLTVPTEKFTISIAATDPRRGVLVLEWGSFRWTAPIIVR